MIDLGSRDKAPDDRIRVFVDFDLYLLHGEHLVSVETDEAEDVLILPDRKTFVCFVEGGTAGTDITVSFTVTTSFTQVLSAELTVTVTSP